MADDGAVDGTSARRDANGATGTAGSTGEPDDSGGDFLRGEIERLANELETLRETVAAREERIDALETRLEDYRRRGERERERLAADAVADLGERMLRVKDSIDAVAGVEDIEADGHLSLVARQFEKEFTAGAVDRIDTDGAYDARRHKMVDRVPAAAPAGEIVRELEAGYEIGDRVLRPARVVVAADEDG